MNPAFRESTTGFWLLNTNDLQLNPSKSATISAAKLSCFTHPQNIYRCEHSALLLPCQYVFSHIKPPWQLQNHFHLLLQTSGMHYQIIFHLFQLFLLLEELSNIIFILLAYPDSSAKSGKIKSAQCITLCDTAPTIAIAQLGNTIPSSWRCSIWAPTMTYD